MSQKKLRYSEFWDRINVEAFEEAIGFNAEDDRNGNDVGYCLWPENHANGDTTGKFGIHREKRVYNCYVCGGGSLLSLAMELFSYDVDEATEWLYQFCEDDTRSDAEFLTEFRAAFEDVQERIDTLPYFNERVLDQFDEPVPQWWLDERQIDIETAVLFGLRYGSEVRRPAPQKGKFAGEPDYYGPAIIFPHTYQERLVGWQSRWLDDDRPEWIAKYTNTTDFPKETTIYGYDLIDRRNSHPVVVVESGPSAIFVHSHDIPCVGTFGSNTNPAQMRLLRKFTSGVILGPDNDVPRNPEATPAGIKWRDALTEYLKHYIPVWHLPVLTHKPGADIGDLASEDDPRAALDEYLASAQEFGVDL